VSGHRSVIGNAGVVPGLSGRPSRDGAGVADHAWTLIELAALLALEGRRRCKDLVCMRFWSGDARLRFALEDTHPRPPYLGVKLTMAGLTAELSVY
jgi:hypothetical protein